MICHWQHAQMEGTDSCQPFKFWCWSSHLPPSHQDLENTIEGPVILICSKLRELDNLPQIPSPPATDCTAGCLASLIQIRFVIGKPYTCLYACPYRAKYFFNLQCRNSFCKNLGLSTVLTAITQPPDQLSSVL